MINLLYVAYNRRRYTEASFAALITNTDWAEVAAIYVHDDGSEDGTREYLEGAIELVPSYVRTVFHDEPLKGPVAAMNWYLDRATGDESDSRAGSFVKIDSDFIVCPKWLNETLRVAHLNPGVDMLGIAPMYGPPVAPFVDREAVECTHIGGIGLIRHRAFEGCRPVADGRMGFTAFQDRHVSLSKAWLKPDLPTFELDRLPFEPWVSLADEYEAQGWSRPWGKYPDGFSAYWSWWL